MVVTNGWDNNLSLYLGRGDGTSATPTILPLKGTSPDRAAVADLRKMGRVDILVAEYESGTIGVLFSNGDGTFQAEQEFATYVNPDQVTVADMVSTGSSVARVNTNGTFWPGTAARLATLVFPFFLARAHLSDIPGGNGDCCCVDFMR